MEKELKKWRDAGKLGARVAAYAKRIIKPDMQLLEIAELVEEKIAELKAKPAFPINLSVNEIAAHSSPQLNDTEVASGLLKIDLGVRVNGALSDIAFSLDLSPEQKYTDLIKASQQALQEAVKVLRPGLALFEVGKLIESTIELYNASPVRNLSGHQLKQWNLHAGLTIPNYDNGNTTKIKEGMILAIEPFATYGEGVVQNGKPSGIYRFERHVPVRDNAARKLLEFIEAEYKSLPFSARWIVKKFGSQALFSLRFLEQANALHHFKQLIEKSKQPVSQAEHTIAVTEKGCEVLTKED